MKLALLTGCFASTLVAVAQAQVVSHTVEYTHDGVTLEGYLAYNEALAERAESGLPGVLVVHEWWGHNEFARTKARELAEQGFIAFALDMYGKGVGSNNPQEASQLAGPFYAGDFSLMRARARAGLDTLIAQENVDADRIVALGFCFGGTVSLQLAYSGAPVKGVVSFHGSLTPPAERDFENIKASILVLHGADDPLVPDAQVKAFQDAMRKSGADWQLIAYGGAVHSFTNPGADAHNIPGVAYHERTDHRAWRHARMFFQETIGGGFMGRPGPAAGPQRGARPPRQGEGRRPGGDGQQPRAPQ